ncbi:hypothetical protein J3Q64DRAFT_1775392 [Phycomyces blakesleeanus]|uniref:Uncharacterized protein n=2 Tax=Phycomyces blakesleeanus TaxID=4837 RepID=A0A163A6A9_PHYB8|nr:hypothetical protein PHYBLDRAFT_78401 [Phycomyces blakesleeanus NRRL 1555(-)]OAD71361.1 hypothetical protein PHYBLDRAFT_78401 [Phycomyces blakesleeanus NRRL 1555(-)]|eukprot:XP_018289401.1 hypothetical protein PHYBLDRAFT_78401 [Phycomyces blakesleeanus NRRL 1555(-)]
MKSYFVSTLLILALGLVYAAPLSSDIISKREDPSGTQNCFDITYPIDYTVWETYGVYDITWTVTGECETSYYAYMVRVLEDENGNTTYEVPEFGDKPIDISLGHSKIALGDNIGEGDYIFGIGPGKDTTYETADMVIINVTR